MINSITKEQEMDMAKYRAHCLAVGRSTDPCNRSSAESAIQVFYKRIGKDTPAFRWCDSPFQMQMVIHIFKKHGKPLDNLGANLRDNLGDNLWANLRANLGANLRDNLGDNLWANKIELEAMYLAGNLDYFWIGYYSWCRRIGIVYKDDEAKLLDEWESLAQSAHFWMPFDGICFLSERPTLINVDESGRLHSDSGMSISYKDGYGQYNVHGVTVPPWIIERPDLITLAKIEAEQNAEVRRIMIDRMGVSRYLQESGASVVCMDMVEVVRGGGEHMPRAVMRDKTGRQFLVGTDGSTERVYYMQCSPDATTCAEAHESMNGGLKDSMCVMQS